MQKLLSILHRLRRYFSPITGWLARGRGVVFLLVCFGLVDLAIWTAFDITGRWSQDMTYLDFDLDEDNIADVDMGDQAYALFIRTFVRFGFCMLPAFCVWSYRRQKTHPFPILPSLLLSGWLCFIALANAIYHGLPQAMAGSTGDEPYTVGFIIATVLTALAFAIPPLSVWLYSRGTVLDRYVTRSFLTPFILCLAGFVSIWLISDMANNGSDFTAGNLSTLEIAELYVIQLPAVLVLVLPITLLLGLLYSLGRMSRSNELVSMMMAGRSVPRILVPVFCIGFIATLISLICNFQWAPGAAGSAESALEAASKKKKVRFSAYDQSFVNRADNRIWFVGRYPQNYSRDNKMESVVIVQFDKNGKLEKTVHSDKAFWQKQDGAWVFFGSHVTLFDSAGEPISATIYPLKYFELNWSETPWRIVSSGINPEFLGLPQIGAYLRAYKDSPSDKLAPFLTQWHNRLALPFGCMTIVLIGAPLGIVYSRRGLVGSATAAVILFFASLFLSNLFVALGQSSRLHPAIAAWLAPVIFSLIGLWLLHLRGHNRELPTLRSLLAQLRPNKAKH